MLKLSSNGSGGGGSSTSSSIRISGVGIKGWGLLLYIIFDIHIHNIHTYM